MEKPDLICGKKKAIKDRKSQAGGALIQGPEVPSTLMERSRKSVVLTEKGKGSSDRTTYTHPATFNTNLYPGQHHILSRLGGSSSPNTHRPAGHLRGPLQGGPLGPPSAPPTWFPRGFAPPLSPSRISCAWKSSSPSTWGCSFLRTRPPRTRNWFSPPSCSSW